MTIQAVIFDWAGTMVDFGSIAPVIAMRRAFAAEGVAISDADVRAAMGMAKRAHIIAALERPDVAMAWLAAHGSAPAQADIDRIFERVEPLMLEAGAERVQLIPGAAQTAAQLRARGIKIGSGTGYSRSMMGPILAGAAAQGYAPDLVVCAGETPVGRPSPLMVWKALVELGIFPASEVVKVDDAPVGMQEGKAAGCFTVGVAASGNCLGLDWPEYQALTPQAREQAVEAAGQMLRAAGADLVIDTVADLVPALIRADRLGA